MNHKTELVPVSITMPIGMAHRLRLLAAMNDMSRSQYVREVLAEALPDDRSGEGPVDGALKEEPFGR